MKPETKPSQHQAARKTAKLLGLLAAGFYLGILLLGFFNR